MTDDRTCYLIFTDDGSDPAYATAREAGLKVAADEGASVVLYDHSSESTTTDPYPVGPWSDSDDAVSASSRLEPDVLRNLGRAYLADQLVEARERGIDAEAYLAQGSGAEAVNRAIELYRCSAVFLPAEIAGDKSLLDRFQHSRLKDYEEEVPVQLRLVDEDGTIHVD